MKLTRTLLILLSPISTVGQGQGKSACRAGHDHYPFCNTSLALDDRVRDLVSRIKAEDKPDLLTARGYLHDGGRKALPYIGVPSYYWGSNCIHSSMFSNCTADGHCYERAAIAAWLKTHSTSPLTRQFCSLRTTPVLVVKSLMERWAADRGYVAPDP